MKRYAELIKINLYPYSDKEVKKLIEDLSLVSSEKNILLINHSNTINPYEILEDYPELENDENLPIYIVSTSIQPVDREHAMNDRRVTNFIKLPITLPVIQNITQ
jgi:hypothetical protein